MSSQDAESAVLTRYAEGPEQLERALAGLDELGLDASRSPGAWTVRQIVHHIVDGDDIWKLCIKSALGNEDGEFTLAWYGAQPQEVWADRWKYSARSVDVSLALFRANRNHVLQLLQHVPDAWQRSIRMVAADGKIRRVTVGRAIQIQADHVMHHIEQIVATRVARGST
jgi:uncharacterized damage-inducible protein DinB